MKKILLTLLLILPLCASAKKVDDSKYLRGAVPEVNGVITFHKSFRVTTMTKEDTYKALNKYLTGLVGNSIPAPTDYAKILKNTSNELSAQVCEWQIYKKKFLVFDRSRFRYTLTIKLDGDNVSVDITNLSYYYMEDNEGINGITYRAEEWISDKEALNKAGTKLLPKSNKFRRRTVDRAEEIFEEIMDAVEQQFMLNERAGNNEPEKRIRKSISE